MSTVIALLGRAAAEALFYVLVAGWYLLCVQWDVVDVLLGGPDLNRVSAWANIYLAGSGCHIHLVCKSQGHAP